ncbi:MAG: hypothetical protein IT560_14505 [Alphaproteobacteria bacterium]|nr:hypothetical protein [Alphaproteobacteria bacterium]
MLKKLWKNWNDKNDAKLRAQHEKRDAELGKPSQQTLNNRAVHAAYKGYWKTALAAIDDGADVNQPINSKTTFNGNAGSYTFEDKISLTRVAMQEKNPAALAALLDRGADKDFIATHSTNGRERRESLAEYAALKIAAREKSYTDIVTQLLDAGAQGYEAALFAAEEAKNSDAILLIRAGQKKNPETTAGLPEDARLENLHALLRDATPEQRVKMLEALQEKFAAAVDGTKAETPPAPKPANKAALRP